MPKKTSQEQIDLMIHLYTVEELSQAKIADRIGCSTGTVGHWLRRYGIRSKAMSDTVARGKRAGRWNRELSDSDRDKIV